MEDNLKNGQLMSLEVLKRRRKFLIAQIGGTQKKNYEGNSNPYLVRLEISLSRIVHYDVSRGAGLVSEVKNHLVA